MARPSQRYKMFRSSDDSVKKAVEILHTLSNQNPCPPTLKFFGSERLELTWTQPQSDKKLFDQPIERTPSL